MPTWPASPSTNYITEKQAFTQGLSSLSVNRAGRSLSCLLHAGIVTRSRTHATTSHLMMIDTSQILYTLKPQTHPFLAWSKT